MTVFFHLLFCIKNEKLNNNNDIFQKIEKISDILLKSNKKKLENGIWNILENNKTESFDLATKENKFKQFNSIMQVLNLMKNIEIFCIKYNLFEGCSILKSPVNCTEYLSPSISVTKNDLLKKANIEILIKNKLANILSD